MIYAQNGNGIEGILNNNFFNLCFTNEIKEVGMRYYLSVSPLVLAPLLYIPSSASFAMISQR